MLSRILAAAFLATAIVQAQTGIHPQSLGIGKGYVFDEDSVFIPFNEGKFHRMLQLNPGTKDWKWLNADDYTASAGGEVVMKSRTEGIILDPAGNPPFFTADGWKTLAQAKGGDGIEQVVLTANGYAAHGVKNKGLSWSADGKEWTAADPDRAGSGAGTIASYKNKVVVFSGSSFQLVSTDGGKKYDIVSYTNPPFKAFQTVFAFRMFSADSFLVITNVDIYTSTDGGAKWTVGNAMPAGTGTVLVRGWDSYVALANGKVQATTDAGANWSSNPVPAGVSSNTLVLIGDELYLWPEYKTKDLGATWTPVLPGFMNASGVGAAFAFAFNGDFGAMGLTGGKIAYTFDRGRSFTVMDTIPSKQDVMALKVLKNNRLLAGDRNGQVFISVDTGKTWTSKLSSSFAQNAVKFSVSADEKTMILTRLGQPAGSGDDGAMWDFLPNAGGTLVQTVKPNGAIIGMANMEWATLYLDKARAKIDTLPSDQGPLDIVAANDDIGWIATRVSGVAAQDNRIYKTTDGFKTFALQATLPKADLKLGRLQAVNADFLVLANEEKTSHYVSADGGKTWAQDSLDVHAKYANWPTIRRVHYFNAKEQIYALTGQVIYLNTGAPGANAVRPRQRAVRAGFSAEYDAYSGRVMLIGLGDARAEVSLFDVQGRRVATMVSRPGFRMLETAKLPKGMYFAQARLGDGRVMLARLLKH